MKQAIEVLSAGLSTLHRMLDEAVDDMTLEQLNWKSNEGGIKPFFSLWHYVRTEDNIINFVVQGKPTVWIEGRFDVKLNLHRIAQGTGMNAAEAKEITLSNLELWREYQHSVWAASEKYLAAISNDELTICSNTFFSTNTSPNEIIISLIMNFFAANKLPSCSCSL